MLKVWLSGSSLLYCKLVFRGFKFCFGFKVCSWCVKWCSGVSLVYMVIYSGSSISGKVSISCLVSF